MDQESVVENCELPNPESAAIGECVYILFFISHPVILTAFGMFPEMVICIVLIVALFFRFDLPHHGINNLQVRSSHFPGLGRGQIYTHRYRYIQVYRYIIYVYIYIYI
jgi:hypothetical protein